VNNFAFGLAIIGLILGIIGAVRASKGRRPYRGLAITAIILAVIASVGVIASQAMYSSAIDEVSKSLDEAGEDLDKITGDSTDEILKDDLTVDIGAFDGTSDEFGMVEAGLPVELTNKADEAFTYDVHIEAVNRSGKRVGEDWAISNDLGPGQSESFDLFTLVTGDDLAKLKSAKFQIVEVSRY